MYSNIEIKNYRGIGHLEINMLKQINLFLGKNNCGKSSLLEALFLLSGASNPLHSVNVNLFREYSKVEWNDILLLFYQLNEQLPIEIKAKSDSKTYSLQIKPFSETVMQTPELQHVIDNATNRLSTIYGFKNTLQISNGQVEKLEFKLNIHPDSKSNSQYIFKINSDTEYKIEFKTKFLSPKFQFQVSVEKLKELKIEGNLQPIIDILRKVDERIVSIDYIDKDVYVDLGFGKLVPINVMGDGIRKLLGIIVSMYECKDGMLFIDEIDNGFHYSLMPLLWQTVLESAKNLNVQVFASTHSIDSLRGLADITSKNKVENMRDKTACYYLQTMDAGIIKSYQYNADKFEFLLNQGEEIR